MSKYPPTTGNLKIIYNMWSKLPLPNIGLTRKSEHYSWSTLKNCPSRAAESASQFWVRRVAERAVDYNVDVDIPLLQREIYTKHFEHKAKYQQK
jgi:hypothetical protein